MILGEFSIWYVENGHGSDGESEDKRKDKAEEGSDEIIINLKVFIGLTDWTGLTI